MRDNLPVPRKLLFQQKAKDFWLKKAVRNSDKENSYQSTKSSMSWKVEVSNNALKFLKRIAAKDATRIKAALVGMVENPYVGDLEKMKGEENVWRRRIGNYRIIFEVLQSEHLIAVYNIKRKTSNTYSRKS